MAMTESVLQHRGITTHTAVRVATPSSNVGDRRELEEMLQEIQDLF